MDSAGMETESRERGEEEKVCELGLFSLQKLTTVDFLALSSSPLKRHQRYTKLMQALRIFARAGMREGLALSEQEEGGRWIAMSSAKM